MTLYPRSLFGRLALLLLAVVALALASTILLFRHDRAALLVRAFTDTKIAQLQAVRAALENSDAGERRETAMRIGRDFNVRVVPEAERPMLGANAPVLPGMQELEGRLREQFGPETLVRASPGRGLLFIRVDAAGTGYWVGFPLQRPAGEEEPWRAIVWSLILAATLLVAAFGFPFGTTFRLMLLGKLALKLVGAAGHQLLQRGPCRIRERGEDQVRV